MNPWRPLPEGAGFVDPERRGDADPYLLWADATLFGDLRRAADSPLPQRVRVVVELASGVSAADWHQELGADGEVTPHYRDRNDLRHCTALLNARACRRWAQAGNGKVVRFELAMPVLPRRTPPPRRAPPQPARGTRERLAETRDAGAVLLGVIDDGCPFAHASFQGPHGPRVLSLWDQDEHPAFGTPALPGGVPAAFGFGREVRRAELQQLMSLCQSGSRVDEDLVYELAGYPALRRHATHGAAVMDRFIGPRRQVADGGASDSADLVFVQLPRDTWADPNALGLSAAVLDGLHHVLAQRTEATRRVVVNLSVAVESGPHNGSTLLAKAIDELVAAEAAAGRQLVVVVPAGNACQARFHARGYVSRESPGELRLQVAPGCESPSFLQVWLEDAAATLRWAVQAPGAGGFQPIDHGHALLDGPEGWRAMAWRSRNGKRGTGQMLLLALAAAPGADSAGAAGEWRVRLTVAEGQPPVFVKAYVARNESELGAPLRHRPAQLVDPLYDPERFLKRRLDDIDDPLRSRGLCVRRWGTRSDLSACASVYVASGVYRRHRPTRKDSKTGDPLWLVPSHYSSDGMDLKRSVAAITEDSTALPGLRVAGSRSGATARLRGTSFAAPQLARAWADQPIPGTKGPPGGAPVLLYEVPEDLRIRLGATLVVP